MCVCGGSVGWGGGEDWGGHWVQNLGQWGSPASGPLPELRLLPGRADFINWQQPAPAAGDWGTATVGSMQQQLRKYVGDSLPECRLS